MKSINFILTSSESHSVILCHFNSFSLSFPILFNVLAQPRMKAELKNGPLLIFQDHPITLDFLLLKKSFSFSIATISAFRSRVIYFHSRMIPHHLYSLGRINSFSLCLSKKYRCSIPRSRNFLSCSSGF